jgi:hypothetical protein
MAKEKLETSKGNPIPGSVAAQQQRGVRQRYALGTVGLDSVPSVKMPGEKA